MDDMRQAQSAAAVAGERSAQAAATAPIPPAAHLALRDVEMKAHPHPAGMFHPNVRTVYEPCDKKASSPSELSGLPIPRAPFR